MAIATGIQNSSKLLETFRRLNRYAEIECAAAVRSGSGNLLQNIYEVSMFGNV